MAPLKEINKIRLIIILLLGFSSGLPLALTGTLLQGWFTVSGLSLAAIGALSLIGQPYVYKFLWAPFLDRYIPPFLGRRRGWLVITQILLLLSIIALGLGNPQVNPYLLAGLALLVAFLSASQDIAIDAYRTDILTPEERGLGAALETGGYRVAMMISGGLGLILADKIGFHLTYLIMAGLMLIGLLASFFAEEPKSDLVFEKHPINLATAFKAPLQEFMSRPYFWPLLLTIVCYKLGDALSVSLATPFLLREIGFSLTSIGVIHKGVGLIATLAGVFLGGILMIRLSMFRALLLFGILQTLAIFTFILIAIIGKNYTMLAVLVFIDNFCNGMGTTALVAFLMSLCDHRYTATQFAILSAIAAIPRVFLGMIAGEMVVYLGWINFFICSIIASLPGIFLLVWLNNKIELVPQRSLNATR